MLNHPLKINVKPLNNALKERLARVLQNYYLYDENQLNNDDSQKIEIIQKIRDSNIVIINILDEDKKDILIGFNKTIIHVQNSSIKLLQPLFSQNPELKFFYMQDKKDIFNKIINISDDQIFLYSEKIYEEINNFNYCYTINHQPRDQIYQIRGSIQSCISGYLIVESYFKLIEEQKIDFSTAFNRTTNQKSIEESEIKEWTEDEYIVLKHLGNGSKFQVKLIYQIDTGHLFAIKKPNNTLEIENTKLNTRELDNYLQIDYPLIPKFYGKKKENDFNYLIVQYIHGQTLNEIDLTKLTIKDRITIIMELMLIIYYLHEKKFVYRDLKPNNVIIDANKTVFLIDFDRMVKIDSPKTEIENFTKSFSSDFVAPEVNYGEISYKNDIYSLGKMIHLLFIENENKKATFFYKKCAENDSNQRLSSMNLLMHNFYLYFMGEIDQKIFDNIPEAQYIQGNIYYEGKYIERDINKSIHYYSLAANQNHPIAQFMLGHIYYKGKYIKRDINKSIYYLSLAANQNDPDAQFMLGYIYYEGKYIERDINKSIHYFSLAANQNHPIAQNNIGYIYYEGKYIERDINKSIHYYSLAANQNDPIAQNKLGCIYYEGKYIKRDINKSIYYLSLAANQNNPNAQNNLGNIYYEGKYIKRDINKSIHYLSLAANQNHPNAQNILGNIYYEGKYIKRDINKSIHYFSLAANQNNPDAQFVLGAFYSNGVYYKKNMIKAIDFFIQSSSNGNKLSNFVVGYFYQEGKHVERDIKKSIHHYKEASTFNNQYAKNNLGVVYRYGCEDQIAPNCGISMSYFEEAIQRFQDKVSMYNLAHIYIYEDKDKSRINKSIKLLIESSKQNFIPSIELICIALIKLIDFDLDRILEELNKLTEKSSKLPKLVYDMIIYKKLLYEPIYECNYQSLRTI